jgi:Uma2 family endonuclease
MNSPLIQSRRKPSPEIVLPLMNGDRMTQAEFHRAYEAYPEDTKFELIGGIVYRASPLRRRHGRNHVVLSYLLEHYASETLGLELLDNATTILGEESEPQPDLTRRILSEFGGQSRETKQDYVEGPPELLAEVAHSSRAIDLHRKRDDYELAGVQEYIVLSVEEPKLLWFDFTAKDSIKPDRSGIARSRAFPGLWINVPALLAGQRKALIATLNLGLKSRAHSAFVKKLEAGRQGSS